MVDYLYCRYLLKTTLTGVFMLFFNNRRYSLRVHISTLFIFLVLLSSGTVSILYYKKSVEMADTQTDTLLARLIYDTIQEIERQSDAPTITVNIAGQHSLVKADNLEERLQSLLFLEQSLLSGKELTSIFVGYSDGDFFLFRKLRGEKDKTLLNAPDNSVWVVQNIENRAHTEKNIEQIVFFNMAMKQLSTLTRETTFDPRTRTWYQEAQKSTDLIRTDPYVFFTYRKVGITFARKFEDGKAVVGADIRMETLSELLEQHKFTPSSHIVLFDQDKKIVAYHDTKAIIQEEESSPEKLQQAKVDEIDVPVLKELIIRWQKNNFKDTGKLLIKNDGMKWISAVIPLENDKSEKLFLGLAIPYHELMAEVISVRNQATFAVVIIILFLIPVALIIARVFAKPIHKLAKETEAVSRFDFQNRDQVKSNIKEVDDLAATISFMKKTISEFLLLIESINKEKNFDTLLEKIGNESRVSAGADAVCIFLVNEETKTLEPGVYCDEHQCLWKVPLCSFSLNDENCFTAAVRKGEVHKQVLQEGDVEGVNELVKAGDKIVTASCIPLKDRQGTSMGVVSLFFKEKSPEKEISYLNERIVFVQKMSSLAGITLETRQLIQKQKELFNAFIKLIAGAIDAKSPYTGGHCQRVPVIASLLAQAACDVKDGAFADFSLDEEQWEELHVASWLHDCGKVTTPEFVVDKATKLETIYDRIHEVRMRFEVLKRDAEVNAWQSISEGNDTEQVKGELHQLLEQLDDDFLFIAKCNEGGEFMSQESIDRLHEIAKRTWTRTLNDREGISWEEGQRKERSESQDLPVVEKILSDKEEHLILRDASDHMAKDNPWGFKIEEPEHLYNKGEVHNLSVARGTLSNEERFKINDHIVQTIKMLNELPYPKHLINVPEIAGGHHETTKGTGYPRKLTADQMSVPAKMMVIADVFEALTASDRPYKKAKKLSEALRIMSFMYKDGHFDAELYKLFLTNGVYRQYGEKYLAPDQVDEVDINNYM